MIYLYWYFFTRKKTRGANFEIAPLARIFARKISREKKIAREFWATGAGVGARRRRAPSARRGRKGGVETRAKRGRAKRGRRRTRRVWEGWPLYSLGYKLPYTVMLGKITFLCTLSRKLFRTLPCVHGHQTIGAIFWFFFWHFPVDAGNNQS